jgi:hypothetical protein
MAYIFKVKLESKNNRLQTFPIIHCMDIVGKSVLQTLLKIEISTVCNNDYEFYIVFHPISDFFGGNGLKRHHLFAQYILINEEKITDKSSSLKFFLITQDIKRRNKCLIKEHDLFFDLIYNDNNLITQENVTKLQPLPIVHITTLDLFDETYNAQFQKNGIIIPRYIKYIDSSIWNQYVPFMRSNKYYLYEEEEGDYEFSKALNLAIKNIIDYTNWKLYKNEKIKAIADFNARLLVNSHLESDLDKHAAYVAPFVFHSETEMKCKAKKILQEIENTYQKGRNENEKLRWSILLIDDKTEDNQLEDGDINVLKYMREIIKSLPIDENNNGIDSAQTLVNIAKEKFNNRRYDIILLDYLLGEKTDGLIKEREYGHELFEKIENNFSAEVIESREKNLKGIFNKFWIMFISAFRNAVHGRLQEKGYSYNTDNWVIARGACPITTPELFKYNLLSFMSLQLKTITKLSLTEAAKKIISETVGSENKRIITVSDLLGFIYVDDASKIRPNAMAFFDALLRIRANYKILRKDVYYKSKIEDKSSSVLVKKCFPDIDKYENSFWEHLQHLVYLTAFGTICQWHDMWEEYVLVRDKIPSSIAEKIKKYIISLKQV